MSKEFKLPELGENIESADVLTFWLKQAIKLKKSRA